MTKIRNFINSKLFYVITLGCLLLPMIIEFFINYLESTITYGPKPFFLKIFFTLKEYKSYYATILTLSFAIFSYNKQQEKLLEEKQKERKEGIISPLFFDDRGCARVFIILVKEFRTGLRNSFVVWARMPCTVGRSQIEYRTKTSSKVDRGKR